MREPLVSHHCKIQDPNFNATAAADGDHADDGGDDNDDDQKGIAKLLPSSDLQITMYNDSSNYSMVLFPVIGSADQI